ncbi:ribosomal RNA small subunit methyltransferase B [Methyloglobulus morosus KoM1]|uniref:16S rRNA (cytosine(967)-C(5))-methyltransferase n=1 Tax=Methyloglobulus morosus KoM1 TaxID=1116472 RepID=V5BZU8_9GAMM|nr:16S rRNA (cytosine(967)-C(5))-methyltransferase RsmB [Methyloglobulus morosus]ESS71767.1 ribosomal RNA small subunit methyltransferase B [Methyloglobulus morosus KoM1]
MNTRWVAARAITRVLQEGQSLTTALDNDLKAVESNQDKAFVQAICYGVCRTYHRLDFILNILIEKPLKVLEVKALLLIGLYQLNYMRVKPHAAVSETVQAARNLPWARALINGVLRNYLRRQDELERQADNVKTAALSHPDWLIKQIERDWPEQAGTILHENNQPPPMALRVNLTKTNREDYFRLMADHDLSAQTVSFCPDGIILDKPAPIEALPKFADGWVSVQDGAAQLAAHLLDVQPGHRVLDVCAAPGGKTAHILERHPDVGQLVAVDIDENRMLRVNDNLRRLNLQATLIVGDATKPDGWWDGKPFDRILLDAPCSATGVIRRHPDIKLLRRETDIAALTILQLTILNAVWPLLASGGMLLYATCSVLKQENEQQLQDFLSSHDDAIECLIADDGWGVPCEVGRQVLTGESSMDGFYYARLIKQ